MTYPMRLLLLVALVVLPALVHVPPVHAGPPSVVGTWKLAAVRTKAGPVPKDKLAGGGMVWQFKADGSLTMTVWKDKQQATANATWKADGPTLTVTEHGKVNKMTYTRKGRTLVLAGHKPSTVVMTFKLSK